MSIIDNFNRIQDSIAESANRCGRDPGEIKTIAVCKTFPVAIIQEAIDSGIKIFGENKIQEAKNKIPQLKGDFDFHMVGHLQSNKAKDAVNLFSLIHSIDKISTAVKLNTEAEKINKVQKILIQVNTSGEETKSGIEPEKILNIIEEVSDLKNVEIHGLMAIAPYTDDTDMIRKSFSYAKKLLDNINSKLNLNLTELSMGMTSDYQIAVEEGATLVRIGTAIFGKRTYV